MNHIVATATQWVGRITVVIALGVLIWNWVDIAGSNSNMFGPSRPGMNAYLSALASSAGLAVSGMFAIGLGLMLEWFTNDQ